MKKIILIAMVASFVLAGCQSNPSKTTTDDQAQTQATATILGVIGGAILGKALGDSARGMAIGAAVGGLIGYSVGNHLAKLKKNRIAREAALEDHIHYVEDTIALTNRYNTQLAREIAQLEEEIEHTRSMHQRERYAQAKLKTKREQISEKKTEASQIYADLKSIYDEKLVFLQQKRRARADPMLLAELEQKVAELNGAINGLRERNRQLASMERAIP